MAVYEQTYRPWAGTPSSPWTRRLVIPRYAFAQLFESRLFAIFYVLCFVYTLGHAGAIYMAHNLPLFLKLGFKAEGDLADLSLGARQLQVFLIVQMVQGLFVTLFVAPTLIARDLHNNGLALYLSRPISKWTYIGGKFAVLATLLSGMTWVAGFLLYTLEALLSGGNWFGEHLRLLVGLFFGSWVMIVVYSLVSLAASAMLRWRPVAMAATFGVLVVGAPFGKAINEALGTSVGNVFDVLQMIRVLWGAFFGEILHAEQTEVSPVTAAVALALVCAAALWILARRVRPYEVVS